MRGKYKRKRLGRKYKTIIEFGRNNSVEFAKKYFGVNLFWCQKVAMSLFLNDRMRMLNDKSICRE